MKWIDPSGMARVTQGDPDTRALWGAPLPRLPFARDWRDAPAALEAQQMIDDGGLTIRCAALAAADGFVQSRDWMAAVVAFHLLGMPLHARACALAAKGATHLREAAP